jgi:hypothetical protein
MENDNNTWEIFDKKMNSEILEVLKEIKSSQQNCCDMLNECKSILNETKEIQKTITSNFKQNENKLINEVEKKVVRESNRIWRMY